MSSAKQPISSLFVLKALCAFMVVGIHTSPGGIVHDAIRPLFDMAVPFFFVVSGYFGLAGDESTTSKRLLKTLQKLVPIIAVTFLVYYAWGHVTSGRAYSLEVLKYYIYHLGVGYPPAGLHLWYLSALGGALLLLYLSSLLPRGLRLVTAIGVVLWGIDLFLGPDFRLGQFWGEVLLRTVLLDALPALSLGYFLRRYESKLLARLPLWAIVLVFVLGACAVFIFPKTALSTLGVTCLVLSSFVAGLRYADVGRGSWLEAIGAKYSQGIYYWHMLIVYSIAHPEHRVPSWSNEALLLLCIVLSVFGAWLVEWLQQRLLGRSYL
ncbi:MAG: acyltransferase [Porphyromonas sp.]|nr:acyltransferase [Porphyromonas sp.]